MAIKLLSITCLKKVPNWLQFKSYFSTFSSAIMSQTEQNVLKTEQNLLKTEQYLSKTSDFDEKIRFLKNELRPESLVKILDTTHDLDSSVRIFKWASIQNKFRHNADTYYKLISKLGMAGNVHEVESYCKKMVKEKFPGQEEVFLGLVEFFVNNGRLDEALRVIKSARYNNIGVFNVLLGALVGNKRDFSDVLLVYKEVVKSGIVPTTDTINYLLEACFDSGRISVALDQYRRMKMKRCEPNSRTFEIVISRLVERDLVDESLVVLNVMIELKFEPDLSFYSCVIPLFCSINKLDVGHKLFNMMKCAKILPDLGVYEALVKCFCENQLPCDARNLVNEMIDCGLTPSDDILLDVVNSLCKLEKFDDATIFLEDKQVWGSDPRNVLLKGYCNIGKFSTAENLFIDMFERGLANTMSWNILIRWLSENTSLDETLMFLGKMIVSSYVPDSATYSALIVCHCKLAKYEDALKLFDHVCSMSWVLDSSSYSELVECLCQNSLTPDAVRVFSYMSNKRCPLQLSPFNMLISLAAPENIGRAIRLLFSANYSGTCSSTGTYNAIMRCLLKSRNIDNLLVLLSRMIVEGFSLDGETYGILTQSMISSGCTEDAVFLFDLMVRKGLSPNSEALNDLLSCFAKHSQLHTILLSIDMVIQNQETLNSEIFNMLIKGLWGEGYKSVASRLLDVMLEKGWVPDATTHGLLMGYVVREGRPGKLAEDQNIIDMQDNVSTILADGLDGG